MNRHSRRALRGRTHDQGFTLIELMVVVIIIGVVAAITLPAYFQQRARAVDSSVTAATGTIAMMIQKMNSQTGGGAYLRRGTTIGNGVVSQNVTISPDIEWDIHTRGLDYCVIAWTTKKESKYTPHSPAVYDSAAPGGKGDCATIPDIPAGFVSGAAAGEIGTQVGVANPPQIVFVYDTSLPRCTISPKTFTLPIAGTVDVKIDWGDRTAPETVRTANPSRTFYTHGKHRITVTGTFTALSSAAIPAERRHCLESVPSWTGQTNTTFLESAFQGSTHLKTVAAPPEGTKLRTLSYAFDDAHDFNGWVNNWDVSEVVQFNSVFRNNYVFNQPLDRWNVAKGGQFGSMFFGTKAFNQPLNMWNVSSSRSFANMFQGSAFNQPLDRWDVSKAEVFTSMFNQNAAFNQDLSSWNTAAATHMDRMFYQASNMRHDVRNWDVRKVTVRTQFGTGSGLPAWPAFA